MKSNSQALAGESGRRLTARHYLRPETLLRGSEELFAAAPGPCGGLSRDAPAAAAELSREAQIATAIAMRWAVMMKFNMDIAAVLPLIDLALTKHEWSLASRICGLRTILFPAVKLSLWRAVVATTMSSGGAPNVTINRPLSLRAKERGDPEGKRSVFGQMFRQLHFIPPAQIRQRDRFCRVDYRVRVDRVALRRVLLPDCPPPSRAHALTHHPHHPAAVTTATNPGRGFDRCWRPVPRLHLALVRGAAAEARRGR